MSKNIVILSGSPRKGGNTDILVDAFKEGAEAAGKNITLFRVADMKIGGCKGCEHCFDGGVCIQKDDMSRILDALRKADTLVLASPVYYMSVSAQLKLAIDRIFALVKEKKTITQAVLLMPCEDDDKDTAGGAVAMFERWLEYEKWENAGIIIVTGVNKPGDIAGHKELETAKALGRDI
jgi:hypothetical protein